MRLSWNEIRARELARTVDEARYIAIGRIGNRCWAAVYTYCGGAIRIISVRRARNEEIERYEGS